MKRFAALFGILLGGVAPPPRALPPGVLTIATSAALAPTLRAIVAGYERGHPGAHFAILAPGSDVAMADLYTRQADLAVIGREANAPELKAYQWIYQRPPNAWPILSGSVALGDHSPAVMVLVDAASPLRVITAAQLGMLFCGKTVPHWRDLGVKGALAGRPIRPVLPDTESGTGRFLRHALFGDATAFAWGRVREAADPAARVAGDLSTLALAGGPPPSGTRRIPILDGATPRTVDDPRYPLARTVYAYGDAGDRAVAGFVAWMKGPEGVAIAVAGPYRSLPGGR